MGTQKLKKKTVFIITSESQKYSDIGQFVFKYTGNEDGLNMEKNP